MPSPTQELGSRLEAAAERLLVERGYAIVARNWRARSGEVDRIAWDGEILVFVEIRARTSDAFGTPAETVCPAKQRRIVRAAASYLMTWAGRSLPPCRFDIVAFLLDGDRPGEAELVKDAFEADESLGRRTPML